MTKRERTKDYLELALEEARKRLPGHVFAVIFQAARARAGGRATARNRLTALESAEIEKTSLLELTDSELNQAIDTLEKSVEDKKRKKLDSSRVERKRNRYRRERKRRGQDDDFVEELTKGFETGSPEGGMHAHGLDRRNSKTLEDGNHVHVFVMPGSGEVFATLEDGSHAHAVQADGDRTEADGQHSHLVISPGGNIEETTLGGAHGHELMVETSGFGGLHKHTLKLADGTEIESLSPGEFAEQFAPDARSGPIPSASEISDALLRLREMQAEEAVLSIEDAHTIFLEGKSVDKVKSFTLERTNSGRLRYSDDPVELELEIPFETEPGDIVEVQHSVHGHREVTGFSTEVEASTRKEVTEWIEYTSELRKYSEPVNFSGPDDSPLLFVGACPSLLEVARGEAIIGPDARVFKELYLDPLGLTKDQVAVGFAIPVHRDGPSMEPALWRAGHLIPALQKYSKARVVALGRVAKEALGDEIDFVSLPHPAAIRRHGDSGEVARKVKGLKKVLDETEQNRKHTTDSPTPAPIQGSPRTNLAETISELRNGSVNARVAKADDEKQIVFSVVLDPYQIDLQDDWIPPAEIEATAYDFAESSRVIGFRHEIVAEGATLVETFVEPYPTPEDREQAFKNLPHNATRRQFGNDTIHSGAWVAGIRLPDQLWEMFKRGELDAFSIGGFSQKTQISADAMPEVTFIDLRPEAT